MYVNLPVLYSGKVQSSVVTLQVKSKGKAPHKSTIGTPKAQPGKSIQQKPHKKLHPITGTSHSAPARLLNADAGGSKSMIPSTWKFVSKYQHRSNGGIPIYSEERLMERREKVCEPY